MRDYIKSRRYNLVSNILGLIYPSQCPVCNNPSDSYQRSPICMDCWEKIAPYSGPSCSICATPLASEYSTVCGECIKNEPPFAKVLNYGLYSGALAEAIHRMKFYGIRRLAIPLGKLLLNLEIPAVDGIVPVPLSKKCLRQREFNQTLLLSKVISKKLKMPLYMDILLKKKDTPPQIGLSAKERTKNLKGAFEVRGNINNLRLLLLDDVMTTGATARECSKALIKAGAEEVIVVTLARAGMM